MPEAKFLEKVDRSHVVILSVFMLSFVAGFAVSGFEIDAFFSLMPSLKQFYGPIYGTLTGAERFTDSAHGVSQVFEDPEGPVERLLKENVTGWTSSRFSPPVKVSSNRFGLREDDFSLEPPQNTTRILVVGDSYVYGYGVNESDRFTDVLEKRLNTESDSDYQVINAAIPGWGPEDYYTFLNEKGIDFNPDVVVVGFVGNDWYSFEGHEGFMEEASDYVEENARNLSELEKDRLHTSKVGSISSNEYLDLKQKDRPGDYSYARNISIILDKNNITDKYYVLDHGRPFLNNWLDRWSEENNETVIYAPEEFRDDWESNFCLKYSPNRVSMSDPHPSPEGHRLLADRLFREIADEEKPFLPWKPQGVLQWVDPC